MNFWFLPSPLSSCRRHGCGPRVRPLCRRQALRVRVEAFSFGFGPRLFGYQIRRHRLQGLPAAPGRLRQNGRRNFAELSDAAKGTATVAPPDDPGAFTSHPRWQRMLIGVAGPVANFILAFVLMVGYFGWINEVPAVEVKPPPSNGSLRARRRPRPAFNRATSSAALPAPTIPTGKKSTNASS
jgi:membrane-associated protease RseP (regulator of RpoE activity)